MKTTLHDYVAALEEECAEANGLIGLLRLAARPKEAADPNYPMYRRYIESRERRALAELTVKGQ